MDDASTDTGSVTPTRVEPETGMVPDADVAAERAEVFANTDEDPEGDD